MKKLSEKIISPKYQGDDFEKKVKEFQQKNKELVSYVLELNQKNNYKASYEFIDIMLKNFRDKMTEKYCKDDLFNCAFYHVLIGSSITKERLDYNLLDFKDGETMKFLEDAFIDLDIIFNKYSINKFRKNNKIPKDMALFNIKKEI